MITGAGQGVGAEIARTFARAGARGVVVNDVVLERAEEVAAELEAAGCAALPVQADVTDYESVSRMAAASLSRFGTVEVLVNNAGNSGADPAMIDEGAFWDIDPRNWRPFVDVNLYGPMNCTRAFLPGMKDAGYGRVVTVISDAGRVGEAGLEAYSAAKAGAAGFTRAIARVAGQYGITANNVAIAVTRTPTTSAYIDEVGPKKLFSRYIIRRAGEPEDIAPVVLLLASKQAGWITGQTYPVNGGYSVNL
ncbi:SDR family oxidoreductase [Nonomuraea sp. NPDC026600]|uniref:SDR family NAD(P)-dependent oxidoreductase n=1 Tax=Nonomuraea sp. NPDC026600 TaxID=3155363 RepID=UPI0033F274D2